MKYIITMSALCFLTIISTSCQRAESSKNKVQIQIANQNVQGQTCTKCLKAVIVNVEGSGFSKIVKQIKSDNMQTAGTEVSGTLTMDIPSGTQRKFQVLGVYLESDSTLSFNYASQIKDLNGDGPITVDMTLSSLGTFKGGSLVGRYLTSTDSGPTGNVNLIISALGHPEMQVIFQQQQIMNGWFSFFASENFPMTYTLDDGTVLFDKVTLDSLVPLASTSTVQNIARIHKPNSYYRLKNGSSWVLETEYSDLVYGFFGAAALTASKVVCFEQGGPMNLNNLSSGSGGTPLLTYSGDNTGAADVFGVQGSYYTANASCFNTASSTRYQSSVISVSKLQLDGMGNDTARGMGGAFSYVYQTGIQKFLTSSGNFTFKGLPGLFDNTSAATFDGVKVYKKLNATNGGFDDLKCNDSWLSSTGFNQVTTFSADPSVSTDTVNFSFITGSHNVNDGFVICPTKSSALKEIGGFFVGGMLNNNVTGSTSTMTFSGASTNTLTLTSTGGTGSTSLVNAITNSSFVTYAGGSYPGTGGTCGTSLAPNASCDIVLASPGGSSESGKTFSIQYYQSPNSLQSITVNLTVNP